MRGRNAGSIFFRRARSKERHGHWYAAVTMADGSRRERPAEWWDNSEARAREILTELLSERDAELVPTRRLTIAAAFASWVADMERTANPAAGTGVRYKTLRAYRYIEAKISPELARTHLIRLGPSALETWLASLADHPRTMQMARDVFRAFLNDQIRRRRIVRSPMDAVSIAPPPAHRATVLTLEQARAIVTDETPDWYHALWVLLLASGIRPGEALGLTWADFDRKAGTIRVLLKLERIQATEDEPGYWQRTKTKAGRTVDVIALPQFAVEALVEHERSMVKARQPGWPAFGQIFVTTRGLPPHKVGSELDALTKRLGLPRLTPHEFRHTSLTLLANAGVPEDVRQRRAGHSTTAMSRRYTTQASLADADAAAALQDALRRTS